MSALVWYMCVEVLIVICATLYIVFDNFVTHKSLDHLPHLWFIAVAWIFYLPRISQLRQQVIDHRRGLKSTGR